MNKINAPGNEEPNLESEFGHVISFPKSREKKTRDKLRDLEKLIQVSPHNFPLFIPDPSISTMIFFNSYEYGCKADSLQPQSFNRILNRSLDFLQYLIDIDELQRVKRFNNELYNHKNKRIYHDIDSNKNIIQMLSEQTKLLNVQIPSVAIELQLEDFTNMLNSNKFFGAYKSLDITTAEAQFRRDFYMKNILKQIKKGKNISFERPEYGKFKVKLY